MKRNSAGYTYVQVLVTVAIIIVVVVLAWMTIVEPNLIRAKLAAEAQSAVASLRVITTAEISYQTEFHGYSPTLAILASPDTAKALRMDDPLISSDLASGSKNGYIFAYTPGKTEGKFIASYSLTADPARTDAGLPHYYTDDSGLIRQNSVRTAGPSDPQL
jgi:type II secretory pathway pseudopilin PulG